MKYIALVFSIVLAFTMTACQTGPQPQEKIYSHLEQAVKLEIGFENQQKEMIILETKEKELYDQIVTLGLKEIEKIKQLSTEALVIVEDREAGLATEYDSMQQSKKEFQKVEQVIEEIEEVQLKKDAKVLVDLMLSRYSTYEELYKAYGESIEYDKQLYNMFQNTDLTLEQLEEQIQKINSSYEEVLSLNERFNKITNEYNQKKKSFYESAGLDITTEQPAK